MARPKPTNRDNEDLIGQHYRLPGALFGRVVLDIDGETEGLLHVASTSGRPMGTEGAAVVRKYQR